jgi:hypothetical protein
VPQAADVTYIYALCDPKTLEVRYVGKSNTPHKRLSFHLNKKSLSTDNAKNFWLRGLLTKGVRPILVVLQMVTGDRWAEAERAWIVTFRMVGAHLTNTSDGGEGVLPPTPETPSYTRRPRRPAPGPKPRLVPRPRRKKTKRTDRIPGKNG